MGEMNFATPMAYFPANQMFEFLAHARKLKCGPFLLTYFDISVFLSFYLFSFLFTASFFCQLFSSVFRMKL